MKKYLLILLMFPSIANATQIVYPVTYGPTSQVTNITLNGNNNAVSSVVNGKLDNTNADTTDGYRFYQSVAVLPSAGNQGSVYFLTSDDTLNFDTGTAFNKSVSVNSPVNGDMLYYNSGWNRLAIGASGFPLLINGAIPSYGELTTASTVSGAAITSLPSVPSGAGQLPLVNLGINITSYGSSTTTGSAVTSGPLKIVFGATSVGSGGVTVTGLPFTSSSTYSCFVTSANAGSGSACSIISASSFSMATVTGTQTFQWMAIGT